LHAESPTLDQQRKVETFAWVPAIKQWYQGFIQRKKEKEKEKERTKKETQTHA